ncbi:MAG: amidohydrolase family protein, partial [Acidobacteriota bacterium]
MRINDSHCHFFSRHFFQVLIGQREFLSGGNAELRGEETIQQVVQRLGLDLPGAPEELAHRWVAELEANRVSRSSLIASVPGDEDSVAIALRHHPDRFVGFFMVDASQPDSPERVRRAIAELGMKVACLFPAMQHFRLDHERTLKVFEETARHEHTAVFAHCGVLTVGIRKRLGLPSQFDIRLGQPLDLQVPAGRFPELPIIIPHFGAGFFSQALMVADLHSNIYLDTSSSNGWIKYHAGLTLKEVLRR